MIAISPERVIGMPRNTDRHRPESPADGIVARSLKKTEEKPLNSGVNCHLVIFPMSLTNPLRFFGHPHNAPFWQQLATVDNGPSEVANRRAISQNAVWIAFSIAREALRSTVIRDLFSTWRYYAGDRLASH